MTDENKTPIGGNPDPEVNPATVPEVTPQNPQPELPATDTPEIIPQETKPEVTPTTPQPEVPVEHTPEPPYRAPQVHTQPCNQPPYQAPQVQAQPYAQPYQPQQAPTQPYAQPYQPQQAPTQPYAQPYQPQQAQAQPYAQYQPYGNQQYPYYAPQVPPQPKKKSAGATVMMICLWVLLGIFSLVLIGTTGYFIGKAEGNNKLPYNENPFSDFFDYIEPDKKEPEKKEPEENKVPEATEALDDSNLYGDGEITLNPYPADKNDSAKYNNQTAFEKISPSTVGIVCYKNEERKVSVSGGSGIILNTDGYIATNSHVIGDSKTAYVVDVVLADGNTYEAKVVGFDTRTDLAVLKIEAKNLVPAEFADSDLASIGEDVIAVGNPGGMEFQNSLTRGVISAKDRTLDLSTQVKYIQTDAAINPGNSGGPLCNIYGQVIGINSAKIAAEQYENMGFAIPSRTVKEVIDDLIKQGYVGGRVQIGIMGTAINATTAKYNNVPQGIMISEVIEDGPCDNGKVKFGDIIVALDEQEIQSFSDIYTILTNYSEGDKVTLKVYRPDIEDYVEIEIVLQADK